MIRAVVVNNYNDDAEEGDEEEEDMKGTQGRRKGRNGLKLRIMMIGNINADNEQDVTDTEINKPVLMNMLWHILMTHTGLFEHLSFHLACYLQVK